MSGRLIKGYYYLVPVWFLIEAFLLPGVRAGVLVGRSFWGLLGFYAVEGVIGAGFWKGSPYAGWAALAENVVYLTASIYFILLGPLDIALAIGSDMTRTTQMSDNYLRALPGEMFSACQVTWTLYRIIYRLPKRPAI